MAQFTYNDFITSNTAPKGADHISVYDDAGNIVGTIPLGSLQPQEEEPLYKFGLLSDIHVDTTDYNYSQYINTYPYSDEGEGDFQRALNWLIDNENVDMFCACGDLSQNGTTTEFAMPQGVISNNLPTSKGIPFYTCTGNHDVKTAGGNGFGNYFLRTFEQTWTGMTDFERSSAFTESFCFNKQAGEHTDHFIFFSMYSYSLGSSASPYLDADVAWLEAKMELWKNDRVFVFTHLFFPDYAGNLGRVNGSGGIYPSGNWLGGSQLTRLTALLTKYKNAIWFSGHSHWKWDLQRFQKNLNVTRYGSDGAWTIHVPSCALPIDSDYTDLGSQTSTNRVEKPLESQGGVVYVYTDRVEIKGIDFNINTSQKGSTTQGYTGTDYVRYLPIAVYNLDTTLKYVGESGEIIVDPIIVGADNIRISIGGNRSNNCSQIITVEDGGTTTIEFTNANQSCILTDESLSSSALKFLVSYDDVTVKLKKVADGTITEVPVESIDNYLGWLKSYSSTDGSVYSLEKNFEYSYELTTQYSVFKYGETSADTTSMYGIQLNTSSKLTSSSNACWIDNYLTSEERATLAAGTESAYHIIVSFTNLRIANVVSEQNSGSTNSGASLTIYTYNEMNSMEVGDSMDVVLVNPHKTNGYILGHNGSSAVSEGNGFATEQDINTSVSSIADNDNYYMTITKKQDTRIDNIETTEDVTRSFNVEGTISGTSLARLTATNVNINGYDAYGASGVTVAATTTRTTTATVTFDGTEFPRTIYAKIYASGCTASAQTQSGAQTQVTVSGSTNNTFNNISSYSAITMTSNTLTLQVSVRGSGTNNANRRKATLVIQVPNDITELATSTIPTEVLDGDPYYTLTSKVGNMSPTGTTGSAGWSSTPMKYTIENAVSLNTTTDLTNGIAVTNNPNLIRFKNPSNYYLNAGGGLSSLKYATGTGEWSVWMAYKVEKSLDPDYLQMAHFETNTNKGSLVVSEWIEDLPNGYVAISFNAASRGFLVVPNNFVAGVQPTLVVEDLKVYSGLHTTSGTEISLPANVGFYEGTNHSGTARYQIATGFQPSISENVENKMQFQTSSSYTGGAITIVMKAKFTY